MSTTPESITSPESVEVAGRVRTLSVVHPRRPSESGSPVVLVFHGSNQTGSTFRSFTAQAFDHIGGSSGAVVAYPDGYRKHWNDARISNSFAARADHVDDVAFTRATIELLVDRYGGDRTQVFAVGFSNGGQMVIRLVHEMPAALAGAAILSATQPAPENFAPTAPQRQPLPVLLMHGTKDPLVPYAGGMASMWGFRPRGLGLSAPETAAYYALRNGITSAPGTTVPDGAGPGRTRVERTDYRQEGRLPVTLHTVHGGGHTVPGPRSAPRIMGRTDHSLDTARVVGDFFGLRAAG